MADHEATIRAWTEAYNRRDEQGWLGQFSEDAEFADLPQGVTAKGRAELLEYGRSWITAFSDAHYEDQVVTVAGDTATMRFTGVGTNDGPFGPFEATGKRAAFPMVNVISFDGGGKIARVEQLYDRATIMEQLGLMPS